MSLDVRTEWLPSIYHRECDESYNSAGGVNVGTEACQQIQHLSEYSHVYPFTHEDGDNSPYILLDDNVTMFGGDPTSGDVESSSAYHYISSNYSRYARGTWGDTSEPLYGSINPKAWSAFNSTLNFVYYNLPLFLP